MTSFEMPQFMPLLPEMLLLGLACVVLLVDIYVGHRNRDITYYSAQASLAAVLLAVLGMDSSARIVTMSGTFVLDAMAQVLKTVAIIVVAGAFLYSRSYLKARDIHKGEFYTLGLFALLGMMIMISAHSFLTVYLGLELLSLSLYALVAFDRDSAVASEAAMKYFVLGALASGMLLYGISILYGITGSLDIAAVGAGIAERGAADVPTLFALTFVVLGLAFKLGAVPFHMWLPDVYHGAPTPVTLFVGSAPKVAAFAMFIRVLAEALQGGQPEWGDMLAVLAFLSLGLGNLVAIAQTNIKRMLAYSTISHAGFLLLGILAGTPQGYAAAMFYAVTYALMALGAFGMIILLSRAGFEADRLEDFKGLNARSPWFAFMMMILMFSMAGVPPTVGFYAKLAVLEAVIRVDMVWLAIAAVAFAVIGAFYYIRVVKLMYFDQAEDTEPFAVGNDFRIALSLNALAILALGIFPGGLMATCAAALGAYGG